MFSYIALYIPLFDQHQTKLIELCTQLHPQKCFINYSSYARSLIYSLLGTMFKIHFDIACLLHIVDTGVNHWLLQQNQLLLINKNKYKILITCSILLVSNFKISMKCRDEWVSLVCMCIFFGTVPFWKENLMITVNA